jgi:hypothetical protein
MKHYDYNKAKETIKSYLKDNRGYGKLLSASLGMEEDWNWTGTTIWLNGKYIVKLTDKTKLSGINGSTWASPVLELEFEDEFVFKIPCYKIQSEHE